MRTLLTILMLTGIAYGQTKPKDSDTSVVIEEKKALTMDLDSVYLKRKEIIIYTRYGRKVCRKNKGCKVVR